MPLPAGLVLSFVLSFVPLLPAWSHTGTSGVRIDQEVRIEPGKEQLVLHYALTLNRPAAYREVMKIDEDQDGIMSDTEQASYFRLLHERLLQGLELRLNGQEIPLAPEGDVMLEMPFTKRYRYAVPAPEMGMDGVTIAFYNENYLDFAGNVTVDIDPGDRFDVEYILIPTYADAEQVDAGPEQNLHEREVAARYRPGSGEQTQNELAMAGWRGGEAPGFPGAGQVHPLMLLLVTGLLLVGPTAFLVGRYLGASVPACAVTALLLLAAGSWSSLLARERLRVDAPVALPSGMEAERVFHHLHQNIYEAFQHENESDMYDVLADSLEGDLLDEIYNEVYQAKVVGAGGTTSFDIHRVKPLDSAVLPSYDMENAFRVRHSWRVYGTVSHYRHKHTRINEYEAIYTVAARPPGWRIVDVQIHQQNRVKPETI